MSFTNTTVANLKLWFKADAGVYTDTGMTTPAVVNDAVAGWTDHSTSANHATQSTSGDRPILVEPTQGGVTYKALRFVSTDWLAFNSALALAGNVTVYAVIRRGGSSRATIVGGGTNSFQAATGTTMELVRVGSTVVITGTALVSAVAPQILQWKYDTAVSTTRNRGAADGSNSASRTWTDLLYIGKVLTSTNPFVGDILEILVFDAAVSSTDNDIIEQYLFEKYEKPSLLVTDGNSMTSNGPSGSGTAHWPSKIAALWDTAEWGYTNIAVSGQTTASMNSDQTTEITPLRDAFRTRHVLVYWEGRNHIASAASQATVQAALETYGSGAMSIGYDAVILLTILPATDFDAGEETIRTTTNTNFRADFDVATSHSRAFLPGAGGTYADMLLDVAVHPDLDDATNGTYFSDGIHLTSAGYQIIADEVKAALDILYPSGPPTNSVAPAVTGTVTTGSTLSCTSGTWTGSPTYAYQWYANSTASTSGGTVIGGATSSNYDLTISELGDYIYCVVTATNGDGSVDEPSNVVGPVTSTPVAPTITTTANHSIGENQTAVTTMAATGDEPITWSIVGGADQALFTIDTNSGALSFLVAPNYESPGDADTNNIYVVQVRATNGAGTANQTKNITITDVDETGRVPQGPVLASAMSPVNPPRAVLRALGLI